ncbi:MAG: 2,3-bisphosphoglycerate-dependent phosphoglycerate mutase [Candidatus Westeberhardia cardiocondylae]|nr:2,3-bisphosphoglycerate-dependent phosphoglycerate mutase [Candidatus Westeberhardia cardiocondylae]
MINNIAKVVFVRHGESQWNYENRFTGWEDIDLSNQGCIEAKNAGLLLKRHRYLFDYSYSSVLTRAIHTLWIILYTLHQTWIPVEKSWRLNERHYGALQGLNKDNTTKKYGIDMVENWRRSYLAIPPQIDIHDKRFPGNDPRYSQVNITDLPIGESLQLTEKRVVPYWKNTIIPNMKKNKFILIVAHGNSIRAMIKFLNCLSEKDIFYVNIPTASPLVYEFNHNMNIIKSYYLSQM